MLSFVWLAAEGVSAGSAHRLLSSRARCDCQFSSEGDKDREDGPFLHDLYFSCGLRWIIISAWILNWRMGALRTKCQPTAGSVHFGWRFLWSFCSACSEVLWYFMPPAGDHGLLAIRLHNRVRANLRKQVSGIHCEPSNCIRDDVFSFQHHFLQPSTRRLAAFYKFLLDISARYRTALIRREYFSLLAFCSVLVWLPITPLYISKDNRLCKWYTCPWPANGRLLQTALLWWFDYLLSRTCPSFGWRICLEPESGFVQLEELGQPASDYIVSFHSHFPQGYFRFQYWLPSQKWMDPLGDLISDRKCGLS